MNSFSPGQILHGFKVLAVEDLSEYRSTGIHLVHVGSGAQLYRILNEDPENLFSFAFRTPPTDDTGVAHILEHSVLCGSEKFPVKDPFLHMVKGSMQTFLNALTFPDKTVYPAATLNEKDYYNLMRVYADAVFFPLLKPAAFYQEGHHKELDEDGNLFLTGVVYNEMKGNYSNPESVMNEWVQRSLFDHGPYALDSGGDPQKIPELTYQQFVDFHKSYYHPSNCLIHLYGSFDTEKQLEFLNSEFLSRFTVQDPSPLIESHPPRSEPRVVNRPYPASEDRDQDKGTLILAWNVGDALDTVQTLSMDILTEILMGDAGLLQKDLLDSGLGEDISPLSGIETELRDLLLAVGLRGSDPAQAPQFEALVLEKLKKYADEGLPKELVESVVTAYEFNHREIKGGVVGFRLMRGSLRAWLHGGTPGEGLAFTKPLNKIKELLGQGPYLENLLRQKILNNPHRCLYLFTPDSQLIQSQEKVLQDRLKKEQKRLTPSDRQALADQKVEIRRFQEEGDSQEALATLPYLTREDLPLTVTKIQSKESQILGLPLTIHEGFTNGVAYVDLAFDSSNLTEEDYKWMGLFPKVLDNLGIPGMEWHLLAREIQKKTGGIHFHVQVDSELAGHGLVERFYVRIKMLESSIEAGLQLLSKILLSADFQKYSRLEELVAEWKNDHYSMLVPSGNGFSALRASSRLSSSAHLSELFRGLTQGEFLQSHGGGIREISAALKRIRDIVITRKNLLVNITGESPYLERLQNALSGFLTLLPETHSLPSVAKASLTPWAKGEVLILPTSVNYSSWVIRGSRYFEPSHAAELVLAHYLGTGPLWEEIRMKGGAYGANAHISGLEGLFVFSTYRDPQLIRSLDSYEKILTTLSRRPLPEVELDSSLIGTIGSETRPRTPRENGLLYLQRKMLGITDELRQKRWDTLLSLRPEDLLRAAESLRSRLTHGTICSFASKESATEMAAERPAWASWVRTPRLGK